MASAYLERLFESYRHAAERGKQIMDVAAEAQRALTPEETEQRDAAFADVSSLKAEIDKIQAFEAQNGGIDAVREAAAPIIHTAAREGQKVTEVDLFRRGFEAVREGRGMAFDSALTPAHRSLGESEIRALSGNVGTAFNSTFADFVAVYERTFTPMLDPNIVTVFARNTGEPLIVPRVTADPAHGGTVTAEGGGINELDMTLSQVTITPFKYGITNLWSAELDLDNTIDLRALMAETTGRELGIDIGQHLTTGTGTVQPNGIVNAASNGGTASGTGTTFGTYLGGTDLISLYYKPAAPYRARGAWMANATTMSQIRSSRDTTGQLLWQPSYILGQPESLLGRPIYENPGMANGSAAKSVIFGDLKRYVVVRVTPTRVALSVDYKFSTDQLALRTIERVGGDLPDVAGVWYLVNAAV